MKITLSTLNIDLRLCNEIKINIKLQNSTIEKLVKVKFL